MWLLFFVFFTHGSLPWALPPDDRCPRDAFEPNDDRAHARRLPGVVADGLLCPGEEDWYAVRLAPGERVTVAILHDRGESAPAPVVFAPRRRKSAGVAYRALGEAGVRLVAGSEGWYRVRLHNPAPEALPYVLLVWPTSLDDR